MRSLLAAVLLLTACADRALAPPWARALPGWSPDSGVPVEPTDGGTTWTGDPDLAVERDMAPVCVASPTDQCGCLGMKCCKIWRDPPEFYCNLSQFTCVQMRTGGDCDTNAECYVCTPAAPL